MKFDDIVLHPEEMQILKELSRAKSINYGSKDLGALLDNHFVHQIPKGYQHGVPDFYGDYYISDIGIRYLEYRRKKWIDKFLSDLRGWITTIIAVAALLKSFWPDISKLIFGR